MTERQRAPLIRPRDRRSQIASHASELFWRQGFDGVSIKEISEAVGLSSAALYKHFSNKHVLLSEPVQELILAWYACSLVAYDRYSNPRAALDSVIDATVTISVDKPSAVGLWYREHRHIPASDYAEIIDMRTRTLSVWSKVLRGAFPSWSDNELTFRLTAAQGLLNCIPLIDVRISRTRLVERLKSAMLAIFEADTLPSECPYAWTIAHYPRPDSSRSELLLEAGARLFRDKGYHRVGIDDIAEAAGIRGPSFYAHFDSKADLLFQLMMRIADALEQTIRAVDSIQDTNERIRVFISSYIEICLEHGDLVAVYATELQNLPADQYSILQKRRSYRTRVLTRLIIDFRPDLTATEARTVLLAALELLFTVSRVADLTHLPQVEDHLALAMMATLRS